METLSIIENLTGWTAYTSTMITSLMDFSEYAISTEEGWQVMSFEGENYILRSLEISRYFGEKYVK